jgi:hypothetical protein
MTSTEQAAMGKLTGTSVTHSSRKALPFSLCCHRNKSTLAAKHHAIIITTIHNKGR